MRVELGKKIANATVPVFKELEVPISIMKMVLIGLKAV